MAEGGTSEYFLLKKVHSASKPTTSQINSLSTMTTITTKIISNLTYGHSLTQNDAYCLLGFIVPEFI